MATININADFYRPPARMAELLVAASDTAKLGPPPQGDIVAYHGTEAPFIGPPTPYYSGVGAKWYWEVPGVFVSNAIDQAENYVGMPTMTHGEIKRPKRIFATRIDPSRAFVVSWGDDTPDYKSLLASQQRTNKAVEDEVKRLGSITGGEGWARFRERYDTVIPPDFNEWTEFDGGRGRRWQAIMVNPRFDTVYLPNPGVMNFDPFRRNLPLRKYAYVPLADAIDQYAKRGGKGWDWVRDIVERAERIPAASDRDDTYMDRPLYRDYAARDKLRSDVRTARERFSRSPDQANWKRLEALESRLYGLTERVAPPGWIAPPTKPHIRLAMIRGPEVGQQGRLF